MHLIYENLIKNLILLWTGKFKDINEGSGSHKLAPHVWEAIGAPTAASESSNLLYPLCTVLDLRM